MNTKFILFGLFILATVTFIFAWLYHQQQKQLNTLGLEDLHGRTQQNTLASRIALQQSIKGEISKRTPIGFKIPKSK